MVEPPTIHALGEVTGAVLEAPSCGWSPKTVFWAALWAKT